MASHAGRKKLSAALVPIGKPLSRLALSLRGCRGGRAQAGDIHASDVGSGGHQEIIHRVLALNQVLRCQEPPDQQPPGRDTPFHSPGGVCSEVLRASEHKE